MQTQWGRGKATAGERASEFSCVTGFPAPVRAGRAWGIPSCGQGRILI